MKLDARQIETRTQELYEKLRAAGLKVTLQRLAVYRVLLQSHGHLTAEQVHQAVARDNPALSLSTVYNVLETLVKIGAIGEITTDGGTKLFDRTPGDHHHFIDTETGEVIDLDDSAGVKLDLNALARRGFAVEGAKLTVYGRRKK
ncbi:MAG: transcriptional repressor [Planctomycetes bacterium]|nr:transcriptional repressor [Planctomycetota bacterium]